MYKYLTNEAKRGRLIALRDAVKPILANNLLPYFTAHDVEHCERVTTVIDAFIEPLQGATNRLTDDELFVVYAAAFLHDNGRLSRRISEAVEAAPSPGSERVACVRVGFPGTREASSSPS